MTTIALTLFVPEEGLRVWSNGGTQNVFALLACFKSAGFDVLLVNGGPGKPPADASMPEAFRGITYHRPEDVVERCDLLIEAGAQVSAEHVARVRARGGKAVTLKFGNALVIDAERAIHDKPAGAIFNGAVFDEVWTTAQHIDTCGPYWEALYRCPVRVLPHVWVPDFVDEAGKALPHGGRYQQGRAKKRVMILEPNINLVKTCHVPMIIADLAYRKRPDLIAEIIVTNATHLRDRLAFSTFAKALDSVHALAADGHHVMSFEARYSTPYYLSKRADVVVSHQWIAVPNYSHYDALHLGYPIVHNVRKMPGYHYEGFDVAEGSRALLQALEQHDYVHDRHTLYLDAAAHFLAGVDARGANNVADHAFAVEALRAGKGAS